MVARRQGLTVASLMPRRGVGLEALVSGVGRPERDPKPGTSKPKQERSTRAVNP